MHLAIARSPDGYKLIGLTLRLSRRGPPSAGLTAARRPPRQTRDAAGANAAAVTLVRFRRTCQRTGPRRLEPRVRRLLDWAL
jgi:hypothetical protein